MEFTLLQSHQHDWWVGRGDEGVHIWRSDIVAEQGLSQFLIRRISM